MCHAAAAPAPGIAVLEAADVARYLLDRKLLSARAVVDGGLRVVDRSRLNRVFVATADRERCLVLKAGGTAPAREAAVLERLRLADRSGELARALPVTVAYDGAEAVLVLESAPDAHDLADHYGRGRFSRTLAREAGRALALLHAIPADALDGLAPPPHRAWIEQLHRPDLDTLHTLSAAAAELTGLVQGMEDVCANLDDLLTGWSEASVVHGDVRWDNCLAVRRSGRWTGLHLIDWELCGPGDPGLDIGAFFGEYLCAWLQSIPMVDRRDPGRLLPRARLPLRRMRPALSAFWDAYVHHRGASGAELTRTLERATRFAAVRLLTAALEEAQTLTELRASAVHLLALSRNILRRPDEASGRLLGLGT
jgi:hypothetical protein